MKIKEISISELKPYANNPRFNDNAIAAVAASIQNFGFKVPIVVDCDGVIVAGHTRVKAAQQLGFETVPCIVADDLTPEQIKAFRIADNKTAELAEWDVEKLEKELQDLSEIEFDMTQFGFDDLADDMPEINEDEAPEIDVKNEPVTKTGDLWQLGTHRLICGDSTSARTVETLLKGDNAALTFTDPPYGYQYQSNQRTQTPQFEVIKNDDKILDFFPLLKKHCTGFVFVCTTWKVLDRWLPLFQRYFELTNMIILNKGGGGMGDLEKRFRQIMKLYLYAITGKRSRGSVTDRFGILQKTK